MGRELENRLPMKMPKGRERTKDVVNSLAMRKVKKIEDMGAKLRTKEQKIDKNATALRWNEHQWRVTESRERERRTVEKESDRVTGEREEKKRNEQKRKQGRGRNGENEEGDGKWPTVKRVRHNPLIDAYAFAFLKQYFTHLKLKTYDGSIDPIKHSQRFTSSITYIASNVTCYPLVPNSLIGKALVRCAHLPPQSISSFGG
ncbi:hypothetical protein M9H77_18323 [Catharanthus roseus]|uniref:Uncharacterized protein n=1 Tax=Catharanthus roseus TaxID=4058 RepID=A0ACC0B745_CATRO|nr:hypothetical protein M9H77_18323 [Catharanthus roseus]